jgi:hypothetical protein
MKPHGVSKIARLRVAVLRWLLLAICLQLSGTGALAVAADSCDGDSGCCSDCPIEQSGHKCPPGCASCHCHQGAMASAPMIQGQLVDRFGHDTESIQPGLDEAMAPHQPYLPSIFRPPRTPSLPL